MKMLRFATNEAITVDSFRNVLLRSTLGERRPLDDLACLKGMIEHSNLTVTAWDDQLLVGVARSVTDFHYCCYLSDLAVDVAYQRQGIGKRLIRITQEALGPHCKIILLSAPAAVDYYKHLGFERHHQAWILPRSKTISEKVESSDAADGAKAIADRSQSKSRERNQ
jgi:ribosomal protein S18 acetylase RimI-like enzyme